jgi:hypothetical protein
MQLKALQECLTDWRPQQLGSALLTYPNVLTLSQETIRHKWRIVSQYAQKQQEQQQQEQPPQAIGLRLFERSAERYALLEYIMMQQQQHQHDANTSNQGMKSSSDGETPSSHVPRMKIVLWTRKHLYERLLQEHHPGFRQWYKQRQQAAKKQGQQPE